jgi:hypothetical protein
MPKVFQVDSVELSYNKKSPPRMWASTALQQAYGYTAVYPEKESNGTLTVRL